MAERKSPPTTRVTEVLNVLAEAPHTRMSLTEIATRLDLNKPTCLGILTALVEANFLNRDESKTYSLGPALLRIGAAAEMGIARLDVVRPFLFRLHSELGMSCILSTVIGDEIAILDRLGPDTGGSRRELVGERYPLRPPLGLANIAWSADVVIDSWLERPHLTRLPADASRLRAVISAARRDGYLVERLTDIAKASNVLLANLVASNLPLEMVDAVGVHLPPVDWSEYLLDFADTGDCSAISHITVPIYDRSAQQRYALSVLVNRVDVGAQERALWIDSALRISREATSALGGSVGHSLRQ